MIVYVEQPRYIVRTTLRTILHAPRYMRYIVKKKNEEEYSARGYSNATDARRDADRLIAQTGCTWEIVTCE